MKKEIVFCTDSLDIGGIEFALISLLNALTKSDKYNIKLCIKDYEKLELLSELPAGIEYVVLNTKSDKKYKFHFIRKKIAKRRFLKFIKTADIIVDFYDGNWFKFFSEIKDKKKIVFFHTILEKLHINKSIDKVKMIYDKYVVLTEGAKRELLKIGISKDKIEKIYNIIPTGEIIEKSKESFETCEEYFIMIGRIVNDSKDYDTVIEVFEDKSIVEKLYIVGDGPYKQTLEEKIKELKLESKVKLLGSNKNPYPILKGAKGLILSSRYEGLSSVILEALVLEKPVISSDCPYGPGEILGERCKFGVLYSVGNKAELSDIIKKFNLANFNVEEGSKKLEEFSEKVILDKIMIKLLD